MKTYDPELVSIILKLLKRMMELQKIEVNVDLKMAEDKYINLNIMLSRITQEEYEDD